MSFLDSIRHPELKRLGIAAIQCWLALDSINRLARESDRASCLPGGDSPDAQLKRLENLQLEINRLFDARIELKKSLPELEDYLALAIDCKKVEKAVFGRQTPSFCRSILRLANDVLSSIAWPGGRPGAALNSDAACEAVNAYVEYAIEEFEEYVDCDDMDYADESDGLGVVQVVLLKLLQWAANELVRADDILAGGEPELQTGAKERIENGEPEGKNRSPVGRKFKPTDDTLKIIKDLQKGSVTINDLSDKHKVSVSSIRTIKSRLEGGQYELTKQCRKK